MISCAYIEFTHQVFSVSHEDCRTQIENITAQHKDQPVWFYSGCDYGSLVNEPMMRFTQNMNLNNGIISYPLERERKVIEFCETQLMKHTTRQIYYPCECYA